MMILIPLVIVALFAYYLHRTIQLADAQTPCFAAFRASLPGLLADIADEQGVVRASVYVHRWRCTVKSATIHPDQQDRINARVLAAYHASVHTLPLAWAVKLTSRFAITVDSTVSAHQQLHARRHAQITSSFLQLA